MTNERRGQRFGHIVERRPHGSGYAGRLSTYVVRDADDGQDYEYSYADIVTEGFRATALAERVRFLIDPDQPGKARYVIRLDLPDVEAYYR